MKDIIEADTLSAKDMNFPQNLQIWRTWFYVSLTQIAFLDLLHSGSKSVIPVWPSLSQDVFDYLSFSVWLKISFFDCVAYYMDVPIIREVAL